jgi:hypothetical protein
MGNLRHNIGTVTNFINHLKYVISKCRFVTSHFTLITIVKVKIINISVSIMVLIALVIPGNLMNWNTV